MKQFLVPGSTARKKARISKRKNDEKDRKDEHPKWEKYSNDKEAAEIPSETEEQALLHEKLLSDCMEKKEITLDYPDKKL